jgi:hypothetical protein
MADEHKKIDLLRELGECYIAKHEPKTLTVRPLDYLMVDGTGDPNSSDFTAAVGALYAVSCVLRSMFAVIPLTQATK